MNEIEKIMSESGVTEQAARILSNLPSAWRGDVKPFTWANLVAKDLLTISRATDIDSLNIRAYFVRRAIQKQAARLGVRWDNDRGRFVPKGG